MTQQKVFAWKIESSVDFWFVSEFWLCFLILFQPNMSDFEFFKDK